MIQEPILLIGAGGHCRACIDVIESGGRFKIAGIVARVNATASDTVLGYPLLGNDDDLPLLRTKYCKALITVGQIQSADVRMRLYGILKELNFDLPVLCSPRAYVSGHAYVGEGTIVMHDVVVNAGARVGENCILNTKSLIEHDAEIGAHCHVSTGAIVNGGTRIGAQSFVGSNAVCVHGISIPKGSFIKAGQLEKGA